MIINKELYEILNLCKDSIKSSAFDSNDLNDFAHFNFSKESLQKIITSNPQIKKLVDIIKEKSKKKSKVNNNFFHVINNNNKKSYKDLKIIIASLSIFSITYNEPKYIECLNSRIYDKIRYLIIEEINKSNNLIQISNGKTSELSNLDDKKDSKNGDIFLPTADLFLSEIYKTKNDNLILNGDELYSFKLKKFSLYSLKNRFETIINNNAEQYSDMQITRKLEQIDNLISSRNITELLKLLEKGIPNSARKKVYMYLLEINGDNSLNNSNKVNETFNEIHDNLMTTDFMLLEDSEDILKNEHYFLFNDIIKKILFRFFRDDKVFTEVQSIRPTILIGKPNTTNLNRTNSFNANSGSSNKQNFTPFPPSGVIPFKGICLMTAPFCYFTTNFEEMYLLFRHFYCKVLSYLTSFSSNKNSSLHLLYNFDEIFSSIMPDLKDYFKSYGFDINSVVLDWFTTCFSELFNPEQLFKIYDILLVTNNYQILIIIALALLDNKKSKLLVLNSKNDIVTLFKNYRFEDVDIFVMTKNYLENSTFT